MKYILYSLIAFLTCGLSYAQNQVEGTFYLFSNLGPIRMDIKATSLVMSIYDSESDELMSVDYTFKEEYTQNGFHYIAYNDVPDSYAVLKIKPEETGNYGFYFLGDFKKESATWSLPNLRKEINRDKANVKIATLFTESNYQKSLDLKDNLSISDADYTTFYIKYVDEISNIITKTDSTDKKALSQWLLHHPYIQMSTISRLLIELGYKPLTDPAIFIEKVMEDPHKKDLIDQLNTDPHIF